MPAPFRTLLVSTSLSLTLGCSFFSLDDEGVAKKPVTSTTGGSAGTGGAGGSSGTVSTAGGTGGSTGGSGGVVMMAGTGGTAGTGGDAALAGTGGTGMAGTGGSAAGAPAGGSGGDMSMGGQGDETSMGGMSAVAGMGGSAGTGGPMTCASLMGSMPFGGHCYLLITSAVNWGAAKSGCSALGNGAHLVTISNGDPEMQSTFDAEMAFVFGMAGGKDTWIGSTDGKMDNQGGDGTPYTWITGEPNPPEAWGMAYGWVSGEPNNYNRNCMNGDSCFEHCGFMVADMAGKWNDALCEDTKQYICEWDMGG